MLSADPEYRSKRPIKISIFGAPGVGKTSIALQYVTEQVVDTSPTTIEDVFRKNVYVRVIDEEIVKRIHNHVNNCDHDDDDPKCFLEKRFQKDDKAIGSDTADISLSLKITDTAGYIVAAEEVHAPNRSFLARLTMKRPRRTNQINPPCSSKKALRYRMSSSVGSFRLRERHEASMLNCDGIVLVYNVLDAQSFATVKQIRNRIYQLQTSSNARKRKANKPSGSFFSKWPFSLCREAKDTSVQDERLPPIFLVGTHVDIRIEKMAQEKSSRLYDVSFLKSGAQPAIVDPTVVKKKKLAKTVTVGRDSIYPHDVYPLISEWKECAGFAEITSRDHDLVQQIFEELNLAIVTPAG